MKAINFSLLSQMRMENEDEKKTKQNLPLSGCQEIDCFMSRVLSCKFVTLLSLLES